MLILGGGFGGAVAAEALAQQPGDKHQIILVSRNRFVSHPFGKLLSDMGETSATRLSIETSVAHNSIGDCQPLNHGIESVGWCFSCDNVTDKSGQKPKPLHERVIVRSSTFFRSAGYFIVDCFC